MPSYDVATTGPAPGTSLDRELQEQSPTVRPTHARGGIAHACATSIPPSNARIPTLHAHNHTHTGGACQGAAQAPHCTARWRELKPCRFDLICQPEPARLAPLPMTSQRDSEWSGGTNRAAHQPPLPLRDDGHGSAAPATPGRLSVGSARLKSASQTSDTPPRFLRPSIGRREVLAEQTRPPTATHARSLPRARMLQRRTLHAHSTHATVRPRAPWPSAGAYTQPSVPFRARAATSRCEVDGWILRAREQARGPEPESGRSVTTCCLCTTSCRALEQRKLNIQQDGVP